MTEEHQKTVADLEEQLMGAKELFAHDLDNIKARYRVLLGERIKQLASDAKDALEIEPPRPDFSKRYLEMLIGSVDAELLLLNARPE